MAELIEVPSTVHLKMKYYTANGLVATLHGDIQEAMRCFEAAAKGLSSINIQPRSANRSSLPDSSKEPKLLPHVETIDLDNQFIKEDLSQFTRSTQKAHPHKRASLNL